MWWDKVRSAASTGLMRTGGVLRKIGEVGAPAIRRVGQIATAIRPAVSTIGAALAPMTDGASMGAASLINKGLGFVGRAAGKADSIAAKVGQFGQTLQGYGAAMK